ncbi:hypothetical protein ABZY09_30725 [Streptomyces sp. NPDC002928]|uniref:hypothetical protein n=1 Tax=Streptomyces sp. NPDC002928 TaxID=3154440 RepID=UPI0033BEC71C
MTNIMRAAPQVLTPAEDPYRLPSESGVYDVSPEMASSWVSYRATHPKLRPLSKSTAARYQADMEAGRWRQATPEGLIFDTEGYIISAQHRLKAQANAGLTLKWRIFVGEPRDIAPFLDQGFRRTAAHVIRVPYARDMGAGARHLAALADGNAFGMPRYNSVQVPEIVATYEAWPELNWYPSEVWAVWKATSIPAGPHLAVLAQASRTDSRLKIEAWLEGLRTGADLKAGDPRLLLRERFNGGFVTMGQVNKRDQMYALIVKAWNAYADDIKVAGQGFRFKVGELLPTVKDFSATSSEVAA